MRFSLPHTQQEFSFAHISLVSPWSTITCTHTSDSHTQGPELRDHHALAQLSRAPQGGPCSAPSSLPFDSRQQLRNTPVSALAKRRGDIRGHALFQLATFAIPAVFGAQQSSNLQFHPSTLCSSTLPFVAAVSRRIIGLGVHQAALCPLHTEKAVTGHPVTTNMTHLKNVRNTTQMGKLTLHAQPRPTRSGDRIQQAPDSRCTLASTSGAHACVHVRSPIQPLPGQSSPPHPWPAALKRGAGPEALRPAPAYFQGQTSPGAWKQARASERGHRSHGVRWSLLLFDFVMGPRLRFYSQVFTSRIYITTHFCVAKRPAP